MTAGINDLLGLNLSDNPLERIRNDAGLMTVFRHVGCIGDSLASGEAVYKKALRCKRTGKERITTQSTLRPVVIGIPGHSSKILSPGIFKQILPSCGAIGFFVYCFSACNGVL